MMKNFGSSQFNQDSFKAAYDADPRIKELVASFDPDGITLKTAPEEPEVSGDDTGAVDDMAASATQNAMAS